MFVHVTECKFWSWFFPFEYAFLGPYLKGDSVGFHTRHKRAIKYHTVRTFRVAFVWHLIKMHFFVFFIILFFRCPWRHIKYAQYKVWEPQEARSEERM